MKRPFMDERDKEIERASKGYALELVTASTQVLTLICIVKGNPAWKGSLSLLFFAAAATLYYKYQEYDEKPYATIGFLMGCIGVILIAWFCLSE